MIQQWHPLSLMSGQIMWQTMTQVTQQNHDIYRPVTREAHPLPSVLLSQLTYLTKPRNIIVITCHSSKSNRQLKIKHSKKKKKVCCTIWISSLVAFKQNVIEENINNQIDFTTLFVKQFPECLTRALRTGYSINL